MSPVVRAQLEQAARDLRDLVRRLQHVAPLQSMRVSALASELEQRVREGRS